MNKNGNLVTAALAVGMSVSAVCAFGALRSVTPVAWGGKPDSWQMKRHNEKLAEIATNGGAKVVCTLRPCRGSETTDAFLREEAAKRGWMLADVAAAARAAKASLDFQDFSGHSLVAKTVLKAVGVDEDTVDFVTKTNLDMPGVRAVTVPTTIYQAKRARDVFAQFGVREIPARDILLALTDPEKRAVWESKRAK